MPELVADRLTRRGELCEIGMSDVVGLNGFSAMNSSARETLPELIEIDSVAVDSSARDPALNWLMNGSLCSFSRGE